MFLNLVGVAALAAWLYLLLGRGGYWRMPLERAPSLKTKQAPRVVAVVPARDEAAVVGRAAGSLARQAYPGEFQIVLVDDHSSDGTAEAAKASSPGGILEVIPAPPLPPGWTGKLWAVSEGVRRAQGLDPDYLLLTDADIVHPPGGLSGLVARAEEGGYDLVSYMVRLQCHTFAEQALIPAFVLFFFQLYPPAWIRDPRRGAAGAAGGCMLIRRTMLERIGGIESIRGELIDDCALAAAVKRQGGKVWLGLSEDARSIRGYETFAEIGQMISRSAFTQLRYSLLLLAGAVAAMLLVYLVPPLLTLAGPPLPAMTGAVAWLIMSATTAPVLRRYRAPIFWAPLLPLTALFYLGATIHSAWRYRRGRGGVWKGRIQAAHES